MTHEEIKKLAGDLGLDPDRLVIREPFVHPVIKERVYRFEYIMPNTRYDYNFFVPHEDDALCSVEGFIKAHVYKALRELKAINGK